MAASAQPPHFAGGWADAVISSGGGVSNNNNNNSNDTSSLGLKMSELNLYNNHNGPPGLSGSTVSTSSIDDRAHPHDSSIDHSSSAAGSFKGSTPSSPINHQEIIGGALSRPPGLLGSGVVGGQHSSVASPMNNNNNNPGLHSKNSSATSPMLTLTPNSSVDGNSDLYSRQASPFQVGSDSGGPAMPFLRNDGQRGDVHGDYGGGIASTFGGGGSFDLVDNNSHNNNNSAINSDNDGLLGLDALRDRAYSSPGPMARSFESAPSLRGGLPPSRGGGGGGGSVAGADAGAPGQRRRGVSRNNSGRSAGSARPPLSGSINNNSTHSPPSRELLVGGLANATGDMSLGGLVVPFPPGGRSGDPSPSRPTQAAQETSSLASLGSASDFSSFGAIGRPEFSGNAREWEPSNRRRSIAGTEMTSANPRSDYYNQYGQEQQQGYEPSRRRSIGTESGREFYHQQHPSQQQQHRGGGGYGDHGQDHSMAQKFGVLPSMSSQMQHKQRMPPHQQGHGHMQQQQQYNPMMVPQAKHQRSYSQPGPRMATPPDHLGQEGGSVGRYPPSGQQYSMDGNNSGHYPRNDPPRYIGAPTPQGHHVRQHSGDSFRSGQSRRSTSMSHGSLSANSYGDGGSMQKRNSQPNMGSGYYGQHQALPNMHPSMQRGMDKSDPYDAHQRRHTYEDDLSLLGEHIEVPADHGIDDGYSQGYGGGGYGRNMRPQIAPPEAMAPHYSGYEGQQIRHLPTAGAALPAPKVVFNVKFKRTQRSFVLGPRIQRDLKVGTYVKVEADRGEDLGIVIGKVPAENYNFSGRSTFRSQSMGGVSDVMQTPTGLSPPGATDLKCIIRLATHDEVSLLAMKRDEEEELLTICRTKVRQRALPMNVVDAEYQFDRHKLTFFFEAEGRIDFRELVRDLFSMYKTRIWMQQLDKNNCSTVGGTSQPPPNATMDYGTPIMAPASEFADYSAGN